MVIDRVGHRVLRVSLAVPVIIDYQISRQPHKPVRQVALFGVILIQSLVDPDKYLLSQVLGSGDAGRKPIRQIKDPPGE
jgi:hypothetical protein